MRHLKIALCAAIAVCVYAPLAGAGTSPSLVFTLDLLGPCTSNGCTGNPTHPTDINLNLMASSFSYAPGTGSPSNFVANTLVNVPIVCDEIASGGGLGANTALRIAPTFTNASPGALLEFNAGGPSIVDLAALTFDGDNPQGIAASYSNLSAPQVVCYQINPISGGAVALAPGPTGIFINGFEVEGTHFSNEPWVSVQTVASPHAAAKSLANPTHSAQSSVGINGVTASDAMGYVVQVHNAANAVGWHLDFGYDYALFDPAVNMRGVPPQWCVLGSSIPQPGPINGSPSCSNVASSHTFTQGDIPTGSNSIFVYVENGGSTAAVNYWSSAITTAIYPAAAAIFPPFGTYPQRFDDKVAVASANNLPTLNIGSIVCNNDKVSTACTILDQDGQPVPAALTFNNAITSGGTASIDPLVYFVDPTSDTTLPGNAAVDALTPSNVSCSDPSGILASPLTTGSFATSTTAIGAQALTFSFAPSGSLYVPGTATCTATFSVSGYVPALSTTQSFTITMQQPNVTHFAVTAPSSATAGAQFSNLVVTALDGANNTVGSYSGTVHFRSTDGNAVLPANSVLTGGTGTFSATLKTAGNRTITATDASTSSITGTSNAIAVSAAAATQFTVIAPATATTGSAFNISVTAYDQFNNTATGYTGTVQFTSTDGAATLPPNQTLTFGVGTPSVTLNTAGSQTITATDTVTASITGISGAITVSSP